MRFPTFIKVLIHNMIQNLSLQSFLLGTTLSHHSIFSKRQLPQTFPSLHKTTTTLISTSTATIHAPPISTSKYHSFDQTIHIKSRKTSTKSTAPLQLSLHRLHQILQLHGFLHASTQLQRTSHECITSRNLTVKKLLKHH